VELLEGLGVVALVIIGGLLLVHFLTSSEGQHGVRAAVEKETKEKLHQETKKGRQEKKDILKPTKDLQETEWVKASSDFNLLSAQKKRNAKPATRTETQETSAPKAAVATETDEKLNPRKQVDKAGFIQVTKKSLPKKAKKEPKKSTDAAAGASSSGGSSSSDDANESPAPATTEPREFKSKPLTTTTSAASALSGPPLQRSAYYPSRGALPPRGKFAATRKTDEPPAQKPPAKISFKAPAGVKTWDPIPRPVVSSIFSPDADFPPVAGTSSSSSGLPSDEFPAVQEENAEEDAAGFAVDADAAPAEETTQDEPAAGDADAAAAEEEEEEAAQAEEEPAAAAAAAEPSADDGEEEEATA